MIDEGDTQCLSHVFQAFVRTVVTRAGAMIARWMIVRQQQPGTIQVYRFAIYFVNSGSYFVPLLRRKCLGVDETIAAIEKDNKQLFIGQSHHPQAQVSMQLRIRHCYRATLNLLGAGSLHEVAGPCDCFGNTGAAPANSFDRSLGRIDRPGERTEPFNQTLCAGFGKEGPELCPSSEHLAQFAA